MKFFLILEVFPKCWFLKYTQLLKGFQTRLKGMCINIYIKWIKISTYTWRRTDKNYTCTYEDTCNQLHTCILTHTLFTKSIQGIRNNLFVLSSSLHFLSSISLSWHAPLPRLVKTAKMVIVMIDIKAFP